MSCRAVCQRIECARCRGAAVGFLVCQSTAVCRAFSARCGELLALALLKNRMRVRAGLSPAGAILVALLCTLGFANEAHAQFAPPTVTNLNPNTGPPGGGTTVTITGTSFFGASAVSFGGNPATFIFNSPTQLTATAPAGTGTVDVRVTAAGGTSAITAADRFTYAVVGSSTSLSSAPNPSSAGQPVTFFDGGTQIGTATLVGGTASFTTSSLSVGRHSITARYDGDINNNSSTSAALIQNVNVPGDSIKLRQMQISPQRPSSRKYPDRPLSARSTTRLMRVSATIRKRSRPMAAASPSSFLWISRRRTRSAASPASPVLATRLAAAVLVGAAAAAARAVSPTDGKAAMARRPVRGSSTWR